MKTVRARLVGRALFRKDALHGLRIERALRIEFRERVEPMTDARGLFAGARIFGRGRGDERTRCRHACACGFALDPQLIELRACLSDLCVAHKPLPPLVANARSSRSRHATARPVRAKLRARALRFRGARATAPSAPPRPRYAAQARALAPLCTRARARAGRAARPRQRRR